MGEVNLANRPGRLLNVEELSEFEKETESRLIVLAGSITSRRCEFGDVAIRLDPFRDPTILRHPPDCSEFTNSPFRERIATKCVIRLIRTLREGDEPVLQPFVDIHCHLAPGIDDGAKSWDETLEMAQMASRDGIGTIVCTPHQMGNFSHNQGDEIRALVRQVQSTLDSAGISLTVLPGADVRIESDMIAKLKSGEVLTLADGGLYVLLELPHELYFPLEDVLDQLHQNGMLGILSHPERNQGILKRPDVIRPLVERGCYMQVTAGSLLGTFGPRCRDFAEWMLRDGLTHFLSTDAHSPKSRRPLMERAHARAGEILSVEAADLLCRQNPRTVVDGKRDIASVHIKKRRSWFPWKRAA
jgi:protein-tyrosine phosphatase